MCQDFLCKQLDKFHGYAPASNRSVKDSKRFDFLEVLKVANLLEDEKILSKAFECMKRNLGDVTFTMNWKEFIFHEDPEYLEKVLKRLPISQISNVSLLEIIRGDLMVKK